MSTEQVLEHFEFQEDFVDSLDTDNPATFLKSFTRNSNQPSHMPTINNRFSLFPEFDVPSSQSQNAFDFSSNQFELFENESNNLRDDHREYVNNDLVELIPGLYRLIDLCKDDGSDILVDKVTISIEGLKNLCNDFVRNSFKSVSEIDYNQLNSRSLKLIGCYGNHILIAKFLLNKKLINHRSYEMLIHSSRQSNNVQETDHKPYLRPGIYFLTVNPKLGLVIHWSEYGCYEDNTSSQRKTNMINLHRYLTKLTDCQICLMSERDLNSFDWKKEKDQEEREDFSGFNISLPKKIKSKFEKLRPKVVESISCQAFFTQETIFPPKIMVKGTAQITKSDPNKEFMDKCRNCSVRINHSTMDLTMLQVLINHGLNMDDIKERLNKCNEALNNAKNYHNYNKEKAKSDFHDDAELLEIFADKKLKELYGRFENHRMDHEQSTKYNEKEFFSKYPDLKSKLNQALKINSPEWQYLKQRFTFGSLLLENVHERALNEELDINEVNAAIWKSYHNMLNGFMYSTPCQIYKDYVKRKIHPSKPNGFEFTDEQIKEYDNQTTIIISSPDSDLIILDKLFNKDYIPSNSDFRISVIELFSDRYNQWKSNIFSSNIRKITPQWTDYKYNIIEKLNREYEKQKHDIENHTFELLCKLIEDKFPNGPLFNIIEITETSYWIMMSSGSYILTYELEDVQPAQSLGTKITIYETMIDQEDCSKIQNDEFHIPKPILPTRDYGEYGYSFTIEPEEEIRHISKFDHPKISKYLIMIWNNKTNRMEFRLDTTKIPITWEPFSLTSKHCLVAINESQGLVGIYDVGNGMLKVFAFDEDKTDQPNLRLRKNFYLEWDKRRENLIPDIKHLLFIKDTKELCFVEKSGRAKIFDLSSGKPRTGFSQFPPESIAILSTPDSTCVVAFVKEQQKSDNIISLKSPKEIIKAYIYFELGGPASKVIELPSSMKSWEFFQFIILHKRQIHLTTLDVSRGSLHSLIFKKLLKPVKSKPKKKLNGLIDSYRLILEQHPSEQNKLFNLHIVLDISRNEEGIDEYSANFKDYTLEMFKDFNKGIRKPHTISTSMTTFQEFDIENLIQSMEERMINYQLGEWVSCLIPVQITVTKNNQFKPLCDESLKAENDQPLRDELFKPEDDQPFRDELLKPEDDQPFRDELLKPEDDQPFCDELEDDQPFCDELEDDQPFCDELEDDQPFCDELEDDQPFCDELLKPEDDQPLHDELLKPENDQPEISVEYEYESTSTKSTIEFDKDLAPNIPGLYCLLDLCKVNGSNNSDKSIISKDYLKKLCNDMVPSSFKSISEINYKKLNSISFRILGCYGNHTLIAKFLLNQNIIDQQTYDLLIASQSSTENKSLHPGIYLLVVNPSLGLVIHWPEIGCYKEDASLKQKNNMMNLHRYLTELTDHQLCFMSDKDLKRFNWDLNNSDLNSEDENEACFEFEVMKSQEKQEDIKIEPGFKMNLSNIKTEMKDTVYYGIPMFPLVVESTINQAFLTRKMTIKLNQKSLLSSAQSFPTELHKILKGHSLTIDRKSMNLEQLKLLVNSGFKTENELFMHQGRRLTIVNRETIGMENWNLLVNSGLKIENELFEQLYDEISDAKSRMEVKINQAKDLMEKDAEIITKIGWNKYWRMFEPIFQENDNEEVLSEEVDRIQSKYPEIEELMRIKIDSPTWIKLKQRFVFTYLIINQVYKLLQTSTSREEVKEHAIKEFYNMFVDEETDIHKLVEKYEQRSQDFFSSILLMTQEKSTLQINQIDIQSKKLSRDKSDSDFIKKDIIGSPFLGKIDDIRRDVLKVFLDEYQKWRKENFPNNVIEMIQKSSFNKKSMDKINEEFSQEKEEIEKCEFERVCDELEKNYRDGTLRLHILNITNNKSEESLRLDYEIEINQLRITIYEASFDKKGDGNYVLNPILSSYYFHIDPTVYDFRKLSQFDNRKFLLVLYNKKLQRIEIFFDTVQSLTRAFKNSDSIEPFKTLNTDENFLIAIDEPKKLIAIFDTKKVVLNVYSLSDDETSLFVRNSNIQLLQWYKNTVPMFRHFLFIKGTEELCFVEEDGRSRIFNLINQQFRPAVCTLPSNTANVLSSPDGSCIVAFVKEKVDRTITDKGRDLTKKSGVKEVCCAHIYFCKDFGGPVREVIKLPSKFQSLESLQFTCIDKLQTHLMSLDSNGSFNSVKVTITIENTQYCLQERMQKPSVKLFHKNNNYTLIKGKNTNFEKIVQKGQNIVIEGEKYNVIKVLSDTVLEVGGNFKSTNGLDDWMEFYIEPIEHTNSLIDVYRLMFEKYPVENSVDSKQNRSLSLKIVLDVDDENIEEYKEKFDDYIIKEFENLRRSTKKPATILKKFSTSVITFQELDIKFQGKYSKYELGEWIIKLCCLIPIQIAIVRNNLFHPLMNDYKQFEFDKGYGLHVDSIAKNISFGWYDGILKYFGDKKVKVISSICEKSCVKSFMLNHLIGTSIDGTCSEGVWMSLFNTKEYIYIALDFEFKSSKRTPQEDVFLTLFNTIVSNIILFKNQSASNRDLLSMFQSFQDSAMLFDSDSKIPEANLCVIIDVPKTDKGDIVKEFESKFSQLILEEREDNFISRMYKDEMEIIPWPLLNDVAWVKPLSNISKKLIMQKAKYENANIFLQNTKVIMAKLKMCDWSSLDETFIQVRVAILNNLLPTVISYGLEQRGPVSEQLKNHDTGEQIGDQIINLSDVLYNSEKSTELLLPDSDIQLYDDYTSFDRLSDYFNNNIQSRKELSDDDSKWLRSFERFLKCIIERRVVRVREWYAQNIVRFPRDNGTVTNGKFELEQTIAEFTLLGTLCGLTCQCCNLKCARNRNHKENHDCLTDHRCYILCDFIEAHNDKLIPTCSHKAGHEGKHTCNKMKHLCGKKCNLIDKLNCQEVCSKKIGHAGEHLCQSTSHYCGKLCKLSTYTQKGDFRCPNRCIIPYDEEHDGHRCENDTCPIQCPIIGCKKSCQSNDHFHSYSDLHVNHFCGNEHPCQEFCEESGICKVTTVPKRQITSIKYNQLDERLRCNKIIPPNEFEHAGKHTHEDNLHTCDVKCQFCGNYCTLPYGHTQIHETRHGNMTQNEFDEFEYAGYNKPRDQAFVLCNLYCKDLGGHCHVNYCQNEENCKLGDQRQDILHIDERVQPNPDKPKDFISHKLFWERTGFKDPYSVQEQREFAKCD